MSFTRIAAATGTTGSTVSTLDTSSTLNVVAGDLLVCFLSGDSNFSSFDCAEDDGTTNIFTVFNPTQDQWYGEVCGYRLVGEASATATFRANFTSAGGPIAFVVEQFRPDTGDIIAFEAGPGLNGPGWSSAAASDNISTAGASLMVGATGNSNSRSISSMQFAGGAADGSGTIGVIMGYAYRSFASSQTSVNYTGTLSGNAAHTSTIMAFSVTSSGSGWTGTIQGKTNPAKINGREVANIAKVNSL